MTRAKGSSSRLSLVAATAVISAVLLEVGLRLLGPAVAWWRSRPAEIGGAGVRILTLGESTTADDYLNTVSWPRQLEEILRARGVNARVVNVAEPGITSIELLERLPGQLDSWRPSLVISMMGINDFPHVFTGVVGKSGWNSIHLVRLAKALGLQARLILWNVLTPEPESFSFPENQDLIGKLRSTKDPGALARVDEKVRSLDRPRDRARYLAYLGFELLPPMGSSESDYEMGHRFLLQSHETYAGVAGVDRELAYQATTFKRYDECMRLARDYYARGIPPNSENISKVFLSCKLASPGQSGWAQVAIPEPFAVSRGSPRGATRESYLRLAGLLRARGIQYFAMGYPRQDIGELRSYFQASGSKGELGSEFSHVRFVSNSEAFEAALKTDGWDRLFIDRFAGSFGHATSEGNRLIATAAAAAILPVIGPPRTSRGD